MHQNILLLSDAENGLTKRIALALRRAGHSVRTAVVNDGTDMHAAVRESVPDLILCPYLTKRIPQAIYDRIPTVVIHPGPVGDRGGSSLDWAISRAESIGGVTALGAVAELDAGPIWAWRTFTLPEARKSDIYNSVVADAAVECALETAGKVGDPAFRPIDQAVAYRPVAHATARPLMRQRDRAFTWWDGAETILRRIRAADGSPGVLSVIADRAAYLFDAHPGRAGLSGAEPGQLLGRRHHAVEIACGAGESIWIGHIRVELENGFSDKAPATAALARAGIPLSTVPVRAALQDSSCPDVTYHRDGPVGTITFTAYNGAMTTGLCHRLAAAIRAAARQHTRVLVLRGQTGSPFSNGLHLGAIELDKRPAWEAWRNLRAINTVCREILMCRSQLTIGAFSGSAGAGGVMLPLGADVVVAIDRAVFDPHYATMGLTGSELHTYTLPRRVGAATARRLLIACEPIDAMAAHEIGLIDQIGPAAGFDGWLAEFAREYAEPGRWDTTMRRKRVRLSRDFARVPLDAYEIQELATMAQCVFDDRYDFARRRQSFLDKTAYSGSRADIAQSGA
ncbi:enoyl-CoA hydratase-related protein [Nocardia arthritidis]|nr:enoyl-CoA hydratase-related protein [Nocardia arthritidis]